MILNFKQFINEKFIPQSDDTFIMASDKNFSNEEEKLIAKFNTYKVEIENIYKSYFNEKDLQNKLFNKGFIKAKSVNPKKKEFKNKYLSKWAKICSLKRELEDLEKISLSDKKDLSTYDQTIADNKGNQTIIDYTQNKVSNAESKLQKNGEKAKEIEREIFNIDRELRKEFELLKKKHKEVKKRIQKQDDMRKSSPVDEEEEKESEENLNKK
jgi:hypothetical protein